MIEHRDAEQLTGLHQVLGDDPIIGTGGQIPRRVVVKQDQCGGVPEDGGLEDLAGMHDGPVEETYRADVQVSYCQ